MPPLTLIDNSHDVGQTAVLGVAVVEENEIPAGARGQRSRTKVNGRDGRRHLRCVEAC